LKKIRIVLIAMVILMALIFIDFLIADNTSFGPILAIKRVENGETIYYGVGYKAFKCDDMPTMFGSYDSKFKCSDLDVFFE